MSGAELAVRVVLKADGSGLVGQLKLSAAELAQFKLQAANAGGSAAELGVGAQQAAAGAEALADKGAKAGAAIGDVGRSAAGAQATVLSLATVEQKLEAILQATLAAANANVGANDRLGTKLIETAAATKVAEAASESLGRAEHGAEVRAEQLGAELTHLSVAARAAAAAQASAAVATGASTIAGQKSVVSAQQQRAAYTQLGFQIQDITSTLALGINPLVVLAQQGGQTAAAIAQMGGRFGGVAGFIAGPFGSVILAAVTIVGQLAFKYFDAGDASDDLSKRQSALAVFLDKTTGKVREQISALARLALVRDAQTGADAQAAQIAKDRAKLGRVIERGTTTQYDTSQGAISQTDPSISAAGLKVVNALYDQYKKRVIDVATLVTKLNAAAASDKTLKSIAKEVERSGVVIDGTNTKLRDYNLIIARTAVANGTATKEQRAFVAANVEATGSQSKLIESQVALATATTDLERARIRYRIVQEGSTKADALGGKALVQYRADLTEAAQAVNAAEAAEQAAREGRVAARKGLTEHNKEVRQATQLNRELETSYDRLSKRLDPFVYNLRQYLDALREITALQAAGKITQGDALQLTYDAGQDKSAADLKAQADRLQAIFKDAGVAIDGGLADLIERSDRVRDAAHDAAQTLREDGIKAVDDIADAFALIFGGTIGGGIRSILNSLNGERDKQTEALAKKFELVGKNLGIDDEGAARIGKKFALAFAGADTGASISAIDKQLGISKALGLKSSKSGAEVGGAIGGATGIPGGDIAGSIIGSVIGGLFKKTKSGAVTLSSANDDGVASGGSSSARAAASAVASSVQDGLKAIAEQLGGGVGAFNVTVGQRHGDYRVTTGTSLKVKNGAQDFNDDAEGAIAAAVRIAITQGAITGLSSAMQQAIQSNPDIDRALAEALKVREVESLIGGLGSELEKAFKDIETTAAERVRVATAYGLDLVKVEEANAKDRADTLQQVLSSRLQSVQSLLDDLAFGDLSEGSPADQRNKLLGEIQKAQTGAEAGTDGAADTLVALQRQLLGVSKSGFGTAGPEYAADRAATVAALERVKSIETDRVNAAANEARKLTSAVEKGNAIADESADTLAAINANLGAIRDAVTAGGTTTATGLISTARQAQF